MVQHLQVFIFQTIEVLTELKQVCVLSKNSFKEKKKKINKLMCCFSSFLIAKQGI